jgi:hypothetical protein
MTQLSLLPLTKVIAASHFHRHVIGRIADNTLHTIESDDQALHLHQRSKFMTSSSTSAETSKPPQGESPQPTIRRVGIFRHRGKVGALRMTPMALVVLTSQPLIREDGIGGQVLNTLGWLSFLAYAAILVWATLFIGGRKNDVLQRGDRFR